VCLRHCLCHSHIPHGIKYNDVRGFALINRSKHGRKGRASLYRARNHQTCQWCAPFHPSPSPKEPRFLPPALLFPSHSHTSIPSVYLALVAFCIFEPPQTAHWVVRPPLKCSGVPCQVSEGKRGLILGSNTMCLVVQRLGFLELGTVGIFADNVNVCHRKGGAVVLSKYSVCGT
jgi:hypothetical protein